MRGRPDWPAEALDLVTEELGLEPSAEVVDLAAGTGKLTRLSVSSVASLPDEERGELADYLRSGLEPVYRMPVTSTGRGWPLVIHRRLWITRA